MKKGNVGIVVLIIALFVTIIALCGVVLYYNLDNNSNVEQNNNENTEAKNEQSNNNTNATVDKCDTNNTNAYSRFIQNYKTSHKTREVGVSQKLYFHNEDEYGQLVDVSIDTEGNATVRFKKDSTLDKKYPNGYRLPEKVFFVEQMYAGNGGYYDLVFISEKGNPIVLGANSLIEGKDISLKYGKNENIINVVNYVFNSEMSGASDYYVVDINGNVSEIQY